MLASASSAVTIFSRSWSESDQNQNRQACSRRDTYRGNARISGRFDIGAECWRMFCTCKRVGIPARALFKPDSGVVHCARSPRSEVKQHSLSQWHAGSQPLTRQGKQGIFPELTRADDPFAMPFSARCHRSSGSAPVWRCCCSRPTVLGRGRVDSEAREHRCIGAYRSTRF